jgi:hypothetical protein
MGMLDDNLFNDLEKIKEQDKQIQELSNLLISKLESRIKELFAIIEKQNEFIKAQNSKIIQLESKNTINKIWMN